MSAIRCCSSAEPGVPNRPSRRHRAMMTVRKLVFGSSSSGQLKTPDDIRKESGVGGTLPDFPQQIARFPATDCADGEIHRLVVEEGRRAKHHGERPSNGHRRTFGHGMLGDRQPPPIIPATPPAMTAITVKRRARSSFAAEDSLPISATSQAIPH